MGTVARSLISILVCVPPALAAAEADSGEGGLLLTLFLGFGAIILVFQLLPSLVLFGSMVKGLFSRTAKETLTAEKQDK